MRFLALYLTASSLKLKKNLNENLMDLNNYTPIYFHERPPKSAHAGKQASMLLNEHAAKHIKKGYAEDVSQLLPGGGYPELKSAPKGKEANFFTEAVKAYEDSKLKIIGIKKEVDQQREKLSTLTGKVNRWASRNKMEEVVHGKVDRPETRLRREMSGESLKLQELEEKFVKEAQKVRINEMQMESARIDLIKKQSKELKNSKEFKGLNDAIGSMLDLNEKAKNAFKDLSSIYGTVNVMEAPYVNGPLPIMISNRRDQMFDVLDKYSQKAITNAEGRIKGIICDMLNEEIEYRDLFEVVEAEG